MMSNFKTKNNKGAAALIITTLFMIISLAMIAGLFTLALSQSRIASNISKSTKAYYAAESIIEDIAYAVNSGASADITTFPQTYPQTAFSDGTQVTSSYNDKSGVYTVIATALGNITRKVSIARPIVAGEVVEFPYVVQAGYMGLSVRDDAVVRGNVYSNGSITGDNSSGISGSVTVAAGYIASSRVPELSYTNEVDNVAQKIRDVTARKYIAQSFIAPTTGQITRIELKMSKTGNPGVSLTMRIYSDVNGKPNIADSYGTVSITPASIYGGAAERWYSFDLTGTMPLTEGETYWIDIGRNDVSLNNFYNVYANTANSQFPGAKYSSDNSNWTDVSPSKALLLKLHVGDGETSFANTSVSAYSAPCANTVAKAWKFLNIPSPIKAMVFYGSGTSPTQSCAPNPATGTNYGSNHPMPTPFPITKAMIDGWVGVISQAQYECTTGVGTECGTDIDYNYTGGTQNLPLTSKRDATWVHGDMIMQSSASVPITLNLKSLLYIAGDLTLTGTDANPCTIQLDNSNGVFNNGMSGYIIVGGKVTIDRCRIFGASSSKLFIIALSSSSSPPPILVRPYGKETSSNGALTYNDTPASVLYAPNGLVQVQGPYSRFAAVYGSQVLLNNNTPRVEYTEDLANITFPSVSETSRSGLSIWRETAY